MISKILNYNIMPYFIKIININKTILCKKSKKMSLLQTLKKNNIHLSYQCCSGYCGTCRIELIHGNILYNIKKPIASVFKKTEIFPCCCTLISDIKIKL